MDFYSVHLYDWPARGWQTFDWSTLRAGGAVEATLDTLEWYDVHEFGFENRKPVVISEYGTVNGQIGDGRPIDWECIRSWNAMFMQFQDRPDYIVKSMPFTPIKATWGDVVDGNGNVTHRYPYTLMNEEPSGSGNWVWSDYIKWYEFWSEVDGTRVDTVSSEPDVQVQAYVDGDCAFLILNNLEANTFTVKLNGYGLGGNAADSVDIKHLYCENWEDYTGTSAYTVLDEYTLLTPPGAILELAVAGNDVVVSIGNGSANAGFDVLTSTNLVEGAGWQVIDSGLSFDAEGNAMITNAIGDDPQMFFKVEELDAPTELTIEAEAFDSTGGSGAHFNADGVTVGVNIYSVGAVGAINWVQHNDWAEYENIELAPGLYQVEYFTGTVDGTDPDITLMIDGVSVSDTPLPINGDWDTFVSTVSGTLVEISAGPQTLRIVASGENAVWQWNMDRFILTKVGELP